MNSKPLGFLLYTIILLTISAFSINDWGFFAHRRINRMAVFTLPPEMMVFYKKHIEYLTEHAVDPDKRRYATKHEAVRHYIDLDQWGEYPYESLPRNWSDALIKFTKIFVVNSQNDTVQIFDKELVRGISDSLTLRSDFLKKQLRTSELGISFDDYQSFFYNNIQNQYYEENWLINCDSLSAILGVNPSTFDCESAYAIENFSEHGILPYHLLKWQKRLTRAFEEKNKKKILQLSADLGHYIGDAHVPLHTTKNYNGQLTDQLGIHAFWESRIPELFADTEYNYFVGKADYIDQPKDFYWNIVLKSNELVDSVLLIEKDLSLKFSQDKQYCFDQRGETTVRTQCKAYADAYRKRMKGMVEEQMRKSIHAIGSAWYTAWIDAGQPDLSHFKALTPEELVTAEKEALEESFRKGQSKGRYHGQ